ncbi:hypothetical protein EDD11_001436 [Mortierella claussenii]|nr:hypothetical protein EDD11_001436 [Mortierella claussenii]
MFKTLAWQLQTRRAFSTATRTKPFQVAIDGPAASGKNVSSEIRTGTVSQHVSAVAAIGDVREAVLQKVREIGATDNVENATESNGASGQGRRGGLVMDGRDIGTVVLPHADLKIFLVADGRVRAERRLREMLKNTADSTTKDSVLDELHVEAVQKDLERRDEQDRTRKVSPLRKAEDAIELDTSNLTIEGQVGAIVDHVERRRRQEA